ncbi:M12 family metallo-peptidase [uncultured Pseudomonas sp.]|uniref:M12 family metallo-peptidase n=1 Tax=uncultured Pseudomonas sp. TaxID=114707 RepID=UPI00280404A0|nr:M12 family metallo-peptidase [uncultured Pseudomonas sp.]
MRSVKNAFIRGRSCLVLLACLSALGLPGTPKADDVPSLITLDASTAKTRDGRPVSEGRDNAKLLLDSQTWLDIPLDRSLTVRVKKLRVSQQSGATVWVGEVQPSAAGRRTVGPGRDLSHDFAADPKNLAILVAHDEHVTGSVIVDGDSYEILPLKNGRVAVSREQDIEIPDAPLLDTGKAREVPAIARSADAAQQPIRVLTVYSNDARDGLADPVAQGIKHFEYFKTVAQLSGVTGVFENAGVVNIDYNQPSKQCQADLTCMNRLLAPVAQLSSDLRVRLKAQVVIAMLDTDGGLASIAGPTSLNRSHAYAAMHNSMTYAHEIGHLLGAHHEDGGTPFPYSNGYCQRTVQPYWHTLMGYCGGASPASVRIGAYSNPRLTYQGLPMGVEGVNDNVRAINDWQPIVAGFFPPPDPAGAPIASGFVELGQKDLPFSGERANLNGAASRNPGVDALQMEWSQVEGAPAAMIDNSQAAIAVAHFPEVQVPTDYRFRLTVRNATGAVDSTDASVRVYPRSQGVACGNVAAWNADQVYSVPGQQVSYQGDVYRQVAPAAGSIVRRAPSVWNGLVAPMNWRLVKACDEPKTLQQRVAAVDTWARANRSTPVTVGLQQQLANLLRQQQLTWPSPSAQGRLRPIEFESKRCVIKDPANPTRLVLREACNEPAAARWLLDGSGRLHAMDTPDLCVRNNGDNQAVTLQPCSDSSTPWIRVKEAAADYQAVWGQALVSDFSVNPSVDYGGFLTDVGGNLGTRIKTPTQSVTYSKFGNIPQDASLLLAHAGADTLKVVGQVMDSAGVPGTAPPMPPMVVISGPSEVNSGDSVQLDASASSSINPGADPLAFTWEAPVELGAQTSGALLRFNAPAVTTPTPYTLRLRVDDGQIQGQEQHLVVVRSPGNGGLEGDLNGPVEILEKTAAVFTAAVRSPDNLPLKYAWVIPPGFTGQVGDAASVTLTAPAVDADTSLPLRVNVRDSNGTVLNLEKNLTVKKDTQLKGGTIVGATEVESEQTFTQHVEIGNPHHRDLTYDWVVTSPPGGAFTVIGASNQRELTLKAPRLLARKDGYIRVVVRDGVGLASIPNKTITVKAFELPPMIGRLVVPNHVNVGDVFEPHVIIDNPEGRELSYRWTVNTANFEVLDSDPKRPSARVKATKSSNNAGLVVQVTVSDGSGRSVIYNTPRVVVGEPSGANAPQGEVNGPLQVVSGQSVRYQAAFTSPVGNPLSYAWVKGVLIGATPNSPDQTWTAPSVTTDQVVTVAVTVSDSARNSVKKAIAVLVKASGDVPEPEPQPPVGKIVSADTVEAGSSLLVSTDATSTPPGDKLNYAWTFSPPLEGSAVNGPSMTLRAAQVNEITPVALQLVVTDSKNASLTLRKSISVLPSARPVAQINGPAMVETGKPLALSAVSSSGIALRYAWQADGFNPPASVLVSPTFTAPAAAGARTIRLTVTDAANRTASASQAITITAPAQSGDCAEPWVASKAYSVNNVKVSYDGYNYEVAHWTQNQRPDLNWVISGSAKPWRRLAPCTP